MGSPATLHAGRHVNMKHRRLTEEEWRARVEAYKRHLKGLTGEEKERDDSFRFIEDEEETEQEADDLPGAESRHTDPP